MASAPRAVRKAAAGPSRARRGPVKRTEAKRSSERWCSAIIRYGRLAVLTPSRCSTVPAGS